MDDMQMLYQDYLLEWLKIQQYSVGPQSWKAMESFTRNHILPSLGGLTLSQLSPIVLQRFVNQLKDKGLASSSVKRTFGVVHSSLVMAEKMQLIQGNPASVVQMPKRQRKELHVWDVKEVQHFLILASRDPYTYVAFHLALLTGMRQGEILGLRWSDVDFESQLVFVRQTLSHDGKQFLAGAKTSSGIRSIALDTDTVNVLKQHQQRIQMDILANSDRVEANDLVVCTSQGKRLTPRALMRVWYRLLRDSGLRHITFHDLRHTHASLLLKNNVHPKIVSERLGHSSIQITLDTYSHLLPNMQREAAGQLGKVILGDLHSLSEKDGH